MIDAVLLFGFMNVLFEFVLLCMMSPRFRLRVLGTPAYRNVMHVSFLLLNMAIHWGTLIGTMSAVMAFISSLVTVQVAMKLFGYVEQGRYYTVGWIKYRPEEIA